MTTPRIPVVWISLATVLLALSPFFYLSWGGSITSFSPQQSKIARESSPAKNTLQEVGEARSVAFAGVPYNSSQKAIKPAQPKEKSLSFRSLSFVLRPVDFAVEAVFAATVGAFEGIAIFLGLGL